MLALCTPVATLARTLRTRLPLCRRPIAGAEMANELELRSAAQRGLAPDRHREVAGAVAGGAAIV